MDSHNCRDHLFISYAWEDQHFARWLALRLTAEGYKVWFDQLKLLGGESWPRDIDIAIKTRTFRMIGLLSRSSITKPNPVKERTLALNIAKQPGRSGFLIPLNVDGLPPLELDWLTSDITFISFHSSWAKGLTQLLKLLDREGCPKGGSDGRAIASSVAVEANSKVERSEVLTSNACRFTQIPSHIKVFRVSPKLEDQSLRDVQRDWACYPVSPHRMLAFHAPSDTLGLGIRAELAQAHPWRDEKLIEGIESRNIVSRLLRGCIESRLSKLGFRWSGTAEAYAFPGPLCQDVRLVLPDDSKTTVQQSGERTFFRVGQPKTRYRYRLATKLTIQEGFFCEFSVIWRLRFDFTDTKDIPLAPTQRLSRRKHLSRSWFNRHWLIRHLAAMQVCSGHDGLVRVGPPGDEVVLDCNPISFTVNSGIDETKLLPTEEISDDAPLEDEHMEYTDNDDE